MWNRSLMENTGTHIKEVVERTRCFKHNAEMGDPCFIVIPSAERIERFLSGVCGSRISKAGFNGKISPISMQLLSPGGRGGGRGGNRRR